MGIQVSPVASALGFRGVEFQGGCHWAHHRVPTAFDVRILDSSSSAPPGWGHSLYAVHVPDYPD
jgi:hypothetical protein